MEEEKIYTCICGKHYTTQNGLHTHQTRHCKILLTKEKYEKEYLHCRSMSLQAAQIAKEKKKQRKLLEIQNWVSEQHICEKCGKVMTEKFGSGRFCSKSCANIRKHSNETKQKISNSLRKSEKFLNSLLLSTSKYTRSGKYNNIFCASTWELAYLIYCIDNFIPIVRCTRWFDYIYNNKPHKYLPDFYLPDTDEYVEIKGKNQYYDEDLVKIKTASILNNNCKYVYIDDSLIYTYINYCKNKYKVKYLYELYDK